jgi:lysophospholipase L1-like esterase
LTLLISTGTATIALEGALRVVGTSLSAPISAARHDLGELTTDPRWQQSPRVGQRLAANFDGTNLWRHGDIIRMGFLPPSLGENLPHLYPLHTDADGFRNTSIRDRIDVAALGDSFTDALTLPIEQGWPMQLERRLGLAVQNYGTAGFGPQQELSVLKDYALRRRPRAVVLAFFAGNDIRDAEVFDATGRTDLAIGHPQHGWPIKDIVSRADTWFLVNALRSAFSTVADLSSSDVSAFQTPPATAAGVPSFDRGLFTVPVNGRVVRWAFMPPYLDALKFSERDLAGRRGWALARESVAEMQRVSQAAGARFMVMFLPSKSQVYLPLSIRLFTKDALTAALEFSLRQMGTHADVDALSRNRLALNDLMRRFCEESGILFLDTTDSLIARLEAGDNVYFPDDSHLNDVGQAVVAAALADFLRATMPGLAVDGHGQE